MLAKLIERFEGYCKNTYMYFAHPIDFFALPILKKIRIYRVWFLFGMSPGVDSYSRHFGTINI